MASYDANDEWVGVASGAAFAPRFEVREAWSASPAPTYPKLQGVVAVAAAFRKDPLGEVELKGLMKGGTVGQAAFTLPTGYRPAEDLVFPVHSEDSTSSVLGSVTVKPTGEVIISIGGNALVSLDGIRFKA